MNELLIITKFKKTIIYIDKILDNFPKKEIILKQKIETNLYDLLENMYYSNYLYDKRINSLYLILSKIKMLDFYIKICLERKIISYNKFINICTYLNEIIKMIYGWINSEKKR